MGGGKRETTVVNQTSQSTPQATPEERRLNQLAIERQEILQGPQTEAQLAGLDLVRQLLTGQEPVPGFFQEMSQGISPEVTQDITRQAIKDISPQFQRAGILDSGVAASIAGRTAGDIRRATAEFNLGNKFNLLNLALSGQAQVQQPLLAQSQILSSRLAGLRPVTTAGTSKTTTSGQSNPFLRSFQSSLGTSLGRGGFGAFKFGG